MAESSETQLALLEQWRVQVETHITNTDKQLQKLQDDRNNALVWGVITLGASVVGMGTWIFNSFAGHIK